MLKKVSTSTYIWVSHGSSLLNRWQFIIFIRVKTRLFVILTSSNNSESFKNPLTADIFSNLDIFHIDLSDFVFSYARYYFLMNCRKFLKIFLSHTKSHLLSIAFLILLSGIAAFLATYIFEIPFLGQLLSIDFLINTYSVWGSSGA